MDEPSFAQIDCGRVEVGGGEEVPIDSASRVAKEIRDENRALWGFSLLVYPGKQGVAGGAVAEYTARPALTALFAMHGAGVGQHDVRQG